MTETEQYVADCINAWVWSGFYAQDEIRDMMEDVLEADCDVKSLQAFLETQVQLKAAAELSWPAETDCDRLDKVFDDLHEAGICALANAGYTMSDGYSDVAEAVAQAPEGQYHGYCFYHEQDTERAIAGQGIMLAFGDLHDDPERDLAVARRIVDALTRAGFQVVWDGTNKTRIHLPSFDWKRRQP